MKHIKGLFKRRKRPLIEWEARCTCGHYRFEHNVAFGCMNFDTRRIVPWCACKAYVDRKLEVA